MSDPARGRPRSTISPRVRSPRIATRPMLRPTAPNTTAARPFPISRRMAIPTGPRIIPTFQLVANDTAWKKAPRPGRSQPTTQSNTLTSCDGDGLSMMALVSKASSAARMPTAASQSIDRAVSRALTEIFCIGLAVVFHAAIFGDPPVD